MEIIKIIVDDINKIGDFANLMITHPFEFYKDGTCGWNNSVIKASIGHNTVGSGGYPRIFSWVLTLPNGMKLGAHSDGPIMDGKYDPFNVITDGSVIIKNETLIHSLEFNQFHNYYHYCIPVNIAEQLQDEFYNNGIIKVSSIRRVYHPVDADWDQRK